MDSNVLSLMACWYIEDLLTRIHMTAGKQRTACITTNPWGYAFQRQKVGQAYLEGLCFSSHTTWGWKYKWGEDVMFDFKYTLAMHSFLFIFTLLVHGTQTSGAVAGSIGVKNLTSNRHSGKCSKILLQVHPSSRVPSLVCWLMPV